MSDLDLARAHLLSLHSAEATKRAAIVTIFNSLAPAIVEWSDAAAACGPAKAVYDSLGGSHLQPFAPLAETLRAADQTYRATLADPVSAIRTEIAVTLPKGTRL